MVLKWCNRRSFQWDSVCVHFVLMMLERIVIIASLANTEYFCRPTCHCFLLMAVIVAHHSGTWLASSRLLWYRFLLSSASNNEFLLTVCINTKNNTKLSGTWLPPQFFLKMNIWINNPPFWAWNVNERSEAVANIKHQLACEWHENIQHLSAPMTLHLNETDQMPQYTLNNMSVFRFIMLMSLYISEIDNTYICNTCIWQTDVACSVRLWSWSLFHIRM